MLKGRRKSGLSAPESAPTDTDNTPSRPRNRLTKPPSLSHNLKSASAISLQDAESKKKAASTESLADSQVVKIAVGKLDNASSVSDIVSRFEASQQAPDNSSQQSLLGLPRKRNSYRGSLTSLINESRPSLQNISSKDRLSALKNDSRTSLTRSPSIEESPDSPRFSRRSSYAPGVATRKSSVAEAIQEEKEPTKPMEKAAPLIPEKVIDEDARSFDEGDDENWFPPSAFPRAETPQSLDYTHLGSMGWGSLQVVNGRASPALSNMSKHLFNRKAGARDASGSEYGDPEAGEQHHRGFLNSDSVYSTYNRHRDFSWQSKASSKLHDEVPPLPSLDTSGADPASFLASEYMAELPQSPYAERQASFGSFAQRAEAAPATRSPSVGSVRSYVSMDVDSPRSSSPTPSSTGSVLRTTTKRTEMEDELFDDGALGYTATSERETPQSWHSFAAPSDPRTQSTQGFQSALENPTLGHSHLEAQDANVVFRDGEAGTITTSVQIESTWLAPEQAADFYTSDNDGFESAMDLQQPAETESSAIPVATQSASPLHQEVFNKQDSGYSSNASLKSGSVERTDRASIDADRRSFVDKVFNFKPILKSRKSSVEMPAFKNIRPATASPQASSTSVARVVVPEPEKPKKVKKLTKRIPLLKQKQPIVLQTIQSIDDLSIPPVPDEATANLQIRAQAVPELETTYSSMNHSRNRNSVSTVGLDEFQIDIRFPSPEPEPERPKQQRRRSWFGKPKEENVPMPGKRDSKRTSNRYSQDAAGISQQHAMAIINEWDLNAASLSSTPYDSIPSRHNSQSRLSQQHQQPSPPPRRPNRLQQRRTMDDKTAADYARRRSASIRERDAWNARKMSMSSDREHPAPSQTKYRSSGMISNAPPASPQQAEAPTPWQHRESPLEIPEPTGLPPSPPESYHIPAPDLPPPPPPHSPRPFDVEHEDDDPLTSDGPAPPPPPHSPRPRSVEADGYFDEPEEYDTPAPPPPSHSPRPMDISDEDPWASQAAAWARRRQHAALQHEESTAAQEEDDLYPVIPLRREMHPHSAGPDFTGYHYPQPRPLKRHTFDIYQPDYHNQEYRPEQPRGRPSFDGRTSFEDKQPRYYNRNTSRPSSYNNTPASRSREVSPRPPPQNHNRPESQSPHPRSRNHSRSPAGSRGHSPAPAFGRFSGGLGYQYDHENNGLGGSAGTRENAAISENAKGQYKGMQLRREWGVDLGDVPVSVLVGPPRV